MNAIAIVLLLLAADPGERRPPKQPKNWGGILEAPRQSSYVPEAKSPLPPRAPRSTPLAATRAPRQPTDAQPAAEVGRGFGRPSHETEKGGWAEEEANGKAPIRDKVDAAPFKPGPAYRKVLARDKTAEVTKYRAQRARNRYGKSSAQSTHDSYQNQAMEAVRQVQGR